MAAIGKREAMPNRRLFQKVGTIMPNLLQLYQIEKKVSHIRLELFN